LNSDKVIVNSNSDSDRGCGMDYKDLEVWKKSIVLVKAIYKICNKFPREETYGLVDQKKGVLFQSLLILQKVAGGILQRNLFSFYIFH
jgi:hypothetical protein